MKYPDLPFKPIQKRSFPAREMESGNRIIFCFPSTITYANGTEILNKLLGFKIQIIWFIEFKLFSESDVQKYKTLYI